MIDFKIWVNDVSEVEGGAITQLKNISSLPWVFKHVAVIPDLHLGKRATVGSVIAMKDSVSPFLVGLVVV
jgi:tRNA-splicing ligase RtcB